jgi:hypothetical protein
VNAWYESLARCGRRAPGEALVAEDQPQTQPMDPADPEVLDWMRGRQETERRAVTASDSLKLLIPRNGDGDGDGDGGGGGGGGGGGAPPPLSSFHAYCNCRANVDWNTCGQAATASLTDFHHKDPYSLPRPGGFWDDGTVIDAIKNGGFGPDVVFGWGTTPDRIRDALRSYGLNAQSGHSGLFFSDWPTQWNSLLFSVYYYRQPAAVLVDIGMLGGPAFGAHWPIAWRMDYTPSGMRVHLANMGSWVSQPMQDQFLQAWQCRQLPYGFNHAAVYCSA